MLLSLFPALFDHPQNLTFTEQEDDEKIELFLRQHGIVNLGWVIGSLLGLIFPVIAIQLDTFFNLNMLSAFPLPIVISGLILWYLLVIAYAFEKFLHWYFNIYIVTNFHIVDINFVSLLYRQINEAQLDDIQSVGTSVKGVFGPVFNFGDVVIETAAENLDLDFANVPKPDLVADRIQDLRQLIDKPGGQL